VFSQVVQSVWGMTRKAHDSVLGPYILKTTPSGGARHPIEVYPVVLNVRGVSPGVYHYSVAKSRLTLLKPGRFASQVVQACAEQHWVKNAAFVCFMTAVLKRTMWKYRSDHAYRVLWLDAGHLGQTFHLVCTQLGLGPFTSAAFHTAPVETLLGIDGIGEIALYVAAAGVPHVTASPDAND
jgi:SagB-type dehydrogenase family enzyme